MVTKEKTKVLSYILCFLLIAAQLFVTSGCVGQKADENAALETVKSFTFTVVDADGNETTISLESNKETVGEVLLEKDLIAGDEGPYGLYVKTVNGKTYDYDTDGKYWAFYIDGEYAASGVDKTPITQGAAYAFKAE